MPKTPKRCPHCHQSIEPKELKDYPVWQLCLGIFIGIVYYGVLILAVTNGSYILLLAAIVLSKAFGIVSKQIPDTDDIKLVLTAEGMKYRKLEDWEK